MRIDGLTLDLRERNAWEAFDLGIALARDTGWKLFLPFGIVFVVMALVLHAIAFLLDWPTWTALVALWWLKPAADRIALAVLGQAVFGAAPAWRNTLDSLASIPRAGLLTSLLWGRIDFARSFHLPVRQLEGQTGKAGRERIRVLDKRLRGHAIWLTVAIWHFVGVLILGLNGLFALLMPDNVHAEPFYFSLFRDTPDNLASQYFSSLVYVLAECMLEPFYVAAGFALYLSRRTALEGWDLEVAFKRMAARIEEQNKVTVVSGAIALLLAGALACTVLVPAPALAQTDRGEQQDQDEPENANTAQSDPVAQQKTAPSPAAPKAESKEKAAVRQVLATPEFEQWANEKTWKYIGKSSEPGKPPRFGDGFAQFLQLIGQLFRGGLWVLAVAVLAWLLYLLVRHFGWFRDNFRMQRVKPDVLFGLDLRPESLPDDVPGAARALLAQGNMRGALALLYRASLSYLIHERDLDIQVGDTEGDCMRLVARAGPAALSAYFAQLMDAWGLIAYAGRKPADAEVTRLIDHWAQHFTVREPPQASAPKAVAA